MANSRILRSGALWSGTICALPAHQVSDLRPGLPWVLISIMSPGDESMRGKTQDPHLIERLDLTFDDVNQSQGNFEVFCGGHAKQILDFFEKHRSKDPLWIIHCLAGVSRSTAVAASIDRILTGQDALWFDLRTPNQRVYSMMLRAAARRGLLAKDRS